MQDVIDRPQLGGVISRMVAITARFVLSDSATPITAVARPAATKAKAEEVHLLRAADVALLFVDLEPQAAAPGIAGEMP